ncbi:MAG: hypothetical protein QM594_15245 [Niabella sp.]
MLRYSVLIVLLVAVSCSQKAISVGEETGKNLVAKVNEKVTVGNIVVTLKEIRESRCPINANCIRAGEAVAVLNVVVNDKSERNIQLCTGTDCNALGLSETYLLFAENQKCLFKLDSITPYPSNPAIQDEKKAYFSVSVSK